MGEEETKDLLQSRIESVPQAVTKEVKAEYSDEDGKTGTESQPRVLLNPRDIRLQIPPPTRGWRLRAKT